AATPPERTIRFVLFNAEEEGLVGSRVYARQQRAQQAPIVAVYQMDMIGYHERPPRAWEVHAGYAQSSEVEARSLALTRILSQVVPLFALALEPPHIYSAGHPPAGPRDHAPVQAQGYAAGALPEGFVGGLARGTPAQQVRPVFARSGHSQAQPDCVPDPAGVDAAAAWASAEAGSAQPQGFAATPTKDG